MTPKPVTGNPKASTLANSNCKQRSSSQRHTGRENRHGTRQQPHRSKSAKPRIDHFEALSRKPLAEPYATCRVPPIVQQSRDFAEDRWRGAGGSSLWQQPKRFCRKGFTLHGFVAIDNNAKMPYSTYLYCMRMTGSKL